MKLRISFSALLFVVFSGSAHAYYVTEESSCTPVDFRKDHPMVIRNQGKVSWCYAHSAADYLQFYFKTPDQISAADLAIQYNLRRWPRFLRWINRAEIPETGFMRSVLWDAMESGYCPETYFPSERWTRRYVNGERKGQRESVPVKEAILDLLGLNDQLQMELYLVPSELPYVYEFKNLTDERFFAIVADGSRKSLLNDLREAACSGKRIQFAGTIDAIGMRPKGRHTFSRINELLDTGTPVNVDFFGGFLYDLDVYSRRLGSLHSTVLMGRKFNRETEECHYLIKNSYGPECKDYDARHQCEAGYVWVSESSLYRAMVTYVYVKDRLFDDTGPDLRIEKTVPVVDDQESQSASDVADETDEFQPD